MAIITPTKVFYGFSTLDTNAKNQAFADIPLIERDLYNHFNTLPGERVMMPTYGCTIWNMLFEPFDDAVVQAVIAEATRIVQSDSRVVLQSIVVNQINQGMLVQMQLFYQPYGVINSFSVQFDQAAVNLDMIS
jgi:phage baseplate assembly protein W